MNMDFDILSAVADVATEAGGNNLELDADIAGYDKAIADSERYRLSMHIEREMYVRQRQGIRDITDMAAEFGVFFEMELAAGDDKDFSGFISVVVFNSLWVCQFRSGSVVGLCYIPASGMRDVARQAIRLTARIEG